MRELKSIRTRKGKQYDSFPDSKAREESKNNKENLEKHIANSGVTSPEDYIQHIQYVDGKADYSEVFAHALRSGKKVVCDGTKTYRFTQPIDVRELTKGHLDGNNATFVNFHIYVNINAAFTNWDDDYAGHDFTIENMVFGASWGALPEGWETPLITTGVGMTLRNFTVKGYPYVLATTDNYIDYMCCENWTFTIDPQLFKGKTLSLDAVSYLGKDGQYHKTPEGASNSYYGHGVAGDGWRFIECSEFRLDTQPDWCLIRPFNKRPILFESCIQSRIDIGFYSNVIAIGCHWEQTYITASALDGNTSATFLNCFFYPTHTLLDNKNVSYINCAFERRYDDEQLTLADVTGGKSWYDLQCHLAGCSFGTNRVADTAEMKQHKNAPKKTWRTTVGEGAYLGAMTTKTAGWQNGFFPAAGTYTYDVFALATSQIDVALKKKTYTAAIQNAVPYRDANNDKVGADFAQLTIGNVAGGYGIVVARTNPDGTVQQTEYYIDPGYGAESGGVTVTFEDQGAFGQFIVSGGLFGFNVFTPWISVAAVPAFTVNEKLYEANGALVTVDDSKCDPANGQVQVFTNADALDSLYVTGEKVLTVNLNDEEYEAGSFDSNGGNANSEWYHNNDIYRTKNYIPVEGGRTIVCTFGRIPQSQLEKQPLGWDRIGMSVYQYDASKKLIVGKTDIYPQYKDGMSSTNLNAVRAVTLNPNTAYIRLRNYHSCGTTDMDTVVIEMAITYVEDAVTTYIPHYSAAKLPYIDIEKMAMKSPNGTLYTLTVTDDGTLGVKELVYKPDV